ncbi:MAG: hypothetical protein K1X83_09865 [Oligoflexia bacterium]|nr:hypothetical protein [Oligoflexia bacterium]
MISNIATSNPAQPSLFPDSLDLLNQTANPGPRMCGPRAGTGPGGDGTGVPGDASTIGAMQFFEDALQMIFSVVDRALSLVYSTLQLPETAPQPNGGSGGSGGTGSPTTPTGNGQTTGGTCACATPTSPSGSVQKLRQLGDFLWKPSGAKDGKLVILIPKKLTGSISTVDIKGPDGKVISTGKFTGVSNGDREHYRFDQPGASYPAGSIVEIHLKTGALRTVKINEPAKRYSY